MKIAVIGAGKVGKTLGAALSAKNHAVVYGVRRPALAGEGNVKSVAAAIEGAEIAILATPWTAAEAVLCEHAEALAGKIVIDSTNPLNPTESGLALGFVTSGAELLQSQVRKATVYKAFNSTGVGVMAEPRFAEGRAAMFVAGPAGPGKDKVLRIVADVGFDPVDAGELKSARLLEPLAMLWLQLARSRGERRDAAFIVARRQNGKLRDTERREASVPFEVE